MAMKTGAGIALMKAPYGMWISSLAVEVSVEPGWELPDDAVAQYVGELKDVAVDGIVGGNVGHPIPVQASGRLLERQVEVRAHRRPHGGRGPGLRVRPAQEIRDAVGVGGPGRGRCVHRRRVPALGGANELR